MGLIHSNSIWCWFYLYRRSICLSNTLHRLLFVPHHYNLWSQHRFHLCMCDPLPKAPTAEKKPIHTMLEQIWKKKLKRSTWNEPSNLHPPADAISNRTTTETIKKTRIDVFILKTRNILLTYFSFLPL